MNKKSVRQNSVKNGAHIGAFWAQLYSIYIFHISMYWNFVHWVANRYAHFNSQRFICVCRYLIFSTCENFNHTLKTLILNSGGKQWDTSVTQDGISLKAPMKRPQKFHMNWNLSTLTQPVPLHSILSVNVNLYVFSLNLGESTTDIKTYTNF